MILLDVIKILECVVVFLVVSVGLYKFLDFLGDIIRVHKFTVKINKKKDTGYYTKREEK